MRAVVASMAAAVLATALVDREGTPILGLLPSDFAVSVNGQTRRVVSATLVKYADTETKVAGSITAPMSLASLRTPGRVPDDARLFVIAVDEPSFLTSDMMPAARARSSSSTTCGQTTSSACINAGNQSVINDVFRRECPTLPGELPDLSCPFAIRSEASSFASFYEAEVSQRIYGLGTLVASLGALPGHKTLVLLSGGLLSTARVGGRPDVRGFMERIGEQASRANVMIYIVHIDNSFSSMFSAARKRTRQPALQSVMRFSDGGAYATGLEMLASQAGGAYLPVKSGTGAPAFGRVLRETMSHYLLGVEPTAKDWDGRKLMIKVKTTAKGATVRAVREIIAK